MTSGAVPADPFISASLVKYWSCSASIGTSSTVIPSFAASYSSFTFFISSSIAVNEVVF